MESGFQDFSEDKPIQASGAYEIYSEMVEDSTTSTETGPLDQRIDSKNWKTRSAAYQEILEDLKSNFSYHSYASKISKFLSDSNPNPQEKALEILSFYLLNDASFLSPYCEQITKTLIEKIISGSRSNLKEIGKELIPGVYKTDKEKVISELFAYVEHKNLKFSTAALVSINSLLKTLGVKDFYYKTVIPCIEKAADNTNISIRTEALNFYKELYKHISKAVEPYVAKLKKQQQDELNKAFAALSTDIKEANVYEFLDSKDIFTQYNDKWADNVLNMEKWSDKRDALEELNNQANFPKLAEKNPGVLVGLAKRLLNDSNVNVLVQAIRLIGYLAKGQKKFFESYAKHFFPVFLAKFKEKKPQVIQEIHKALDNLVYSVKLESVIIHIQAALQDKAISTRLNTIQWIEKVGIFHIGSDEAAKEIFLIVKNTLEDNNEGVREAGCSLLKEFIHKYKKFAELLSDLPAAKLKKIESAKSFGNSIENTDFHSTHVIIEKNHQNSNPQPFAKENNRENIDLVIDTIIPSSILQNLNEKSWKPKQTGLTDLKDLLTSSMSVQDHCKIHTFLTKTMNIFKENNPNILKSGLECLNQIHSIIIIPEDCATSILTPSALEKLSDSKVSDLYKSCILSASESVTPDFVTKTIIKNSSECVKPKTCAECLEALGLITKEFGPSYVNLRIIAEHAKNALANSNPIIKKSAVNLLGVLYTFQETQILEFLSGLKESILMNLKEEFKKIPNEAIKEFRKIKCKAVAISSSEIIKKTNISAQITPSILKDLSDSNWKLRKETLDKIDALISKKIAPVGLAELFRQLKLRLSDPNKSIIKLTLSILSKLADALGNDCAGYCRLIIPHILSNLADKQSSLRKEVKFALDKWAANAGAENVITLAGIQLSQDNPELRLDILSWILSNKKSIEKSDVKALIPGVISCLQDKVASIRNQAEFLFGEIVEFTGFDDMTPFLKDIKPAFLQSLQIVFDKYRSNEAKTVKNKPGVKRIVSKTGKGFEFRVVKEKRVKVDGMRWIFDEMRPDQIEAVKTEIKACTSDDLHGLLINSDFKRKLYACDVIKGMIGTENIAEGLELIFKWCFLEIGGGNTQIIKTVLELVLSILAHVKEKNILMNDVEAELLIPSLCEKISFNNGFYYSIVSNILKDFCECYSHEKVYSLILCGLNSRSCAKSECLSELFKLYSAYKGNMTAKDIKCLAKYLKSPENTTRGLVLKILSELYKVQGKKIWESIGSIDEKTSETLVQAFKGYEIVDVYNKSNLESLIEKLSFKDLDSKFEALCYFNNQILPNFPEHEAEINKLSSDISEMICKVSRFTFSSPFKEVPKKFTIFFMKIVNTLFFSTGILKNITKTELRNLYDEFINRAGEVDNDLEIQTVLSDVLLTLLEYSEINFSLSILIALLGKNKDYPKKLEINIKCIIKLSKILSKCQIKPQEILQAMHKHLTETKYPTIDNGLKALKTLLQELVFIYGEEIWSFYSVVSQDCNKDSYICSWINDVLSSRYPLFQIFKKMLNEENYFEGKLELSLYLNNHPNEDISFLLKRFPVLASKLDKDSQQNNKSLILQQKTLSIEEIEMKFSNTAKQRQDIDNSINFITKTTSSWTNYK